MTAICAHDATVSGSIHSLSRFRTSARHSMCVHIHRVAHRSARPSLLEANVAQSVSCCSCSAAPHQISVLDSILGKLSLVQAGDTRTIPFEPTVRNQADSDTLHDKYYPGGRADSALGSGDGTRLWHMTCVAHLSPSSPRCRAPDQRYVGGRFAQLASDVSGSRGRIFFRNSFNLLRFNSYKQTAGERKQRRAQRRVRVKSRIQCVRLRFHLWHCQLLD
jgi:hypothetical protein